MATDLPEEEIDWGEVSEYVDDVIEADMRTYEFDLDDWLEESIAAFVAAMDDEDLEAYLSGDMDYLYTDDEEEE